MDYEEFYHAPFHALLCLRNSISEKYFQHTGIEF